MNKNLQKLYTCDADTGVWRPSKAPDFGYSDGDEVEAALFTALSAVEDRSIFSAEIKRLQTNWPFTYHLSARRANLLRPLEDALLKGKKVLELGCGCGGLTRYLGEAGAEVLAVEGSFRRASIAALRCEGLNGVTVLNDVIQKLPKEAGKFDVVTLVGVLEYARVYDGGKGAELRLLQTARSFLRPGGTLIVALENKLGLKYFAGVPEDHLGRSWAGVMDAYAEDGVVTFSRKELQALLEEAGFSALEQFIPIPDYKLPASVLHPEALTVPEDVLRKGPLLAMRLRAHEDQPLFNTGHSWESVCKAELLPDLCDSLCFTAVNGKKKGKGTDSPWQQDVLLSHYGEAYAKEFAKELRICREAKGLMARRRYFFQQEPSPEAPFAQVLQDEPYVHGELLFERMRRVLLTPGWTSQELAAALRPWALWMRSQEIAETGRVSGALLDASPFNIIIDKNNALVAFDQEWHGKETVGLAGIMVRHLMSSFVICGVVASPADEAMLYFWPLVLRLLRLFSIPYEDGRLEAEVEHAYELDGITNNLSFQTSMLFPLHFTVMPATSGAIFSLRTELSQARHALDATREEVAKTNDSLRRTLDELHLAHHGLRDKDADMQKLRHTIGNMQAELAGLYASRSWRITKPLRKLAQLWRSLSRSSSGLGIFSRLPAPDSWRNVRDERQDIDGKKTYLMKKKAVDIEGFAILLRGFFSRLAMACRTKGIRGVAHAGINILRKGGIRGILAKLKDLAGMPPERISTNAPVLLVNGYVNAFDGMISLEGVPELHEVRGKIALHLHLFYTDLAEEFATHFQRIPYPFDLFVSVTSEADKSAGLAAFSRVDNCRRLVVRVVPNRGRDIAPLFCAFREDIAAYDYVGHFHTKKTSGAGHDWRRYLVGHLLGDASAIKKYFYLLEKENFSIVYPQTFPTMSSVANDWLVNAATGRQLLHRLGLAFPAMYFDYPVGSMCWVKGSVLQPLFALGLTLEDFAEEAGQVDGTLAHALERVVGVCAAAQGPPAIIKSRVYHKDNRWDMDSHADIRSRVMHLATLPEVKMVVFDIFDTLLLRPFFSSADMKRLLVHSLSDAGEKEAFARYRDRAEDEARQEVGRDVGMGAIYSRFARLSGLPESRVAALRSLEEELEIKAVCENSAICPLLDELKKMNKRVCFASDMFLSRGAIEEMLRKNKVPLPDALYLSSEVGLRKDSGDLYGYILEQEGLLPEEALMVGDNPCSDIQIPALAGWKTCKVARPADMLRSMPAFAGLAPQDPLTLHESVAFGLISRRLVKEDCLAQPFAPYALFSDLQGVGYSILGPILLSFADWLASRAEADGVERLFFLARDGKVMRAVYERWRAAFSRGPESEYCLVSRRAVQTPSLRGHEDVLAILSRPTAESTLENLFLSRIGYVITPEQRRHLKAQALWLDTWRGVHDEEFEKLSGMVAYLLPDILEQARMERAAIETYCKEIGMSPRQRAAIVDVGYTGTIQKHLSRLLGGDIAGYYAMTRDNFSYHIPPAVYLAENLSVDDPLYKISLRFERLLTADEGQVVRHHLDEQGRSYVETLPLSEREKAACSVRRTLHEGMFAYIDDAIEVKQGLLPDFTPSVRAARQAYEALQYLFHIDRDIPIDDYYCGHGLI